MPTDEQVHTLVQVAHAATDVLAEYGPTYISTILLTPEESRMPIQKAILALHQALAAASIAARAG